MLNSISFQTSCLSQKNDKISPSSSFSLLSPLQTYYYTSEKITCLRKTSAVLAALLRTETQTTIHLRITKKSLMLFFSSLSSLSSSVIVSDISKPNHTLLCTAAIYTQQKIYFSCAFLFLVSHHRYS